MATQLQKQPLVKGGHIKSPDKLPSTFISSTMPTPVSGQTAGIQAANDQNIVDTMADHMAHGRLKDMARTFHETCPGDWTLATHISLSSRLLRFYKGLEVEHAGMLEGTIRYRWEVALLADHIVETFRLPVPRNEICIMWNSRAWANEIEKKFPESEVTQRWLAIAAKLTDSFDLPRLPQQGPPFERPMRYVVAALIESEKPWDTVAEICDGIVELMGTVRAFQNQRIRQDPEVRQRGREWLGSIGRRA